MKNLGPAMSELKSGVKKTFAGIVQPYFNMQIISLRLLKYSKILYNNTNIFKVVMQ